jgi:PTS system nitrogen regulatory IIA component
LLSPERDGPLHLRRLSSLSRLFKCDALVTKIKDAKDETTIRSLLIDPQGWMLAA